MAKPRAKVVMPVKEDIGPVRYSQERLFWGADPSTAKELKKVWKDEEQLATESVPEDVLCVVIMMAAWGRRFGIDIVDDYDLLLQRARDLMEAQVLHHPDLFFVSCICILHRRNEEPTVGGFEQLAIPEHFANLIGGDA
jgi:hypothetical protein